MRNWNHKSPPPLTNTAVMATFLSLLFVFVLAARQVEALPILAAGGGVGEDGANLKYSRKA